MSIISLGYSYGAHCLAEALPSTASGATASATGSSATEVTCGGWGFDIVRSGTPATLTMLSIGPNPVQRVPGGTSVPHTAAASWDSLLVVVHHQGGDTATPLREFHFTSPAPDSSGWKRSKLDIPAALACDPVASLQGGESTFVCATASGAVWQLTPALDGTCDVQRCPLQVPDPSHARWQVRSVTAGAQHSCCITASGALSP